MHRACVADARVVLRSHVVVDEILLSSVTIVPTPASATVKASATTPSRRTAPVRAATPAKVLHVDGPVWELHAFEGRAGRLGELLVAGCLSRLLRDQASDFLRDGVTSCVMAPLLTSLHVLSERALMTADSALMTASSPP